MKNVLIINPWIYDFAAYDYWMKPIGLLYVASYLRENHVNVTFLDCLDPVPYRHLIKLPKRKPGGHGHFLKEIVPKPPALTHIERSYHRYGVPSQVIAETLRSLSPPDLILSGVTMTYWYPGLWEIIRLVRKLFPVSPIAIGGPYTTLCPDHARRSGADLVLPGPGELHIPFLVRDVLGLPLQFQPDASSPDTLPYPAYDLIPDPDQLPLLTSRGCPYRCPYCASHQLNPHFSRRDPVQVVEEMFHWVTHHGVTQFALYDDAFLVEAERFAHPLMEVLIHRGLGVRLHCPNGLHVREITTRTADLMYRSGVTSLRLGLETADEQQQLDWGGKVRNAEFEAAIHHLTEAGYDASEIGVYLLCGLPYQTPDAVLGTMQFIKKHGARPILAEYSPIPGTILWKEAIAASPYPLEEEPLYQNNSLLPCWRSKPAFLHDYRTLKSREKDVEIVP